MFNDLPAPVLADGCLILSLFQRWPPAVSKHVLQSANSQPVLKHVSPVLSHPLVHTLLLHKSADSNLLPVPESADLHEPSAPYRVQPLLVPSTIW